MAFVYSQSANPPTPRIMMNVIFFVVLGVFTLSAANACSQPAVAASGSTIVKVTSKDGTPIAVECAGVGPTLVIVHGGTGDHTRWKPLFPFLVQRFTVCAMDRRGHGASGDSPDYSSLQKEFEDVAAVVASRPDPVFVLGHSYGGLCALVPTELAGSCSHSGSSVSSRLSGTPRQAPKFRRNENKEPLHSLCPEEGVGFIRQFFSSLAGKYEIGVGRASKDRQA